jgi:hypothetical protein
MCMYLFIEHSAALLILARYISSFPSISLHSNHLHLIIHTLYIRFTIPLKEEEKEQTENIRAESKQEHPTSHPSEHCHIQAQPHTNTNTNNRDNYPK